MDTGSLTRLILVILLGIAVATDIGYQRIPNWLTLPAMLVAVVLNTTSVGLPGFLFSCGGILVGIAVMIIPYLMGGMGAGDAKLMGAVGGLLGPKGVFVAFLITAVIGGVYALGLLAFYGGFRETLARYGQMLKVFSMAGKINYVPPSTSKTRPRLRYGIAIALGTMIAVFMQNSIFEIMHLF